MSAHLRYNRTIALDAKHWSESLLSLRKAVWPTAKVVGHNTTHMRLDIGHSVDRSANDIPLAEERASLGNRHILFAQMHTIGTNALYQHHIVIDDKRGAISATHIPYDYGRMLHKSRLHPLHT